MKEETYLQWLVRETPTRWWHDSADPDELRLAVANGAGGVTTNPLLVHKTLKSNPEKWAALLESIPGDLPAAERAEALLRGVTRRTAEMMRSEYERTAGKSGYVCAQVSPLKVADAGFMTDMAVRIQGWAPNVTVKLPGTAAGLEAMEECSARGINVTVTVSFTVPQVIAVAERYRLGMARARKAGILPGRCWAVIMIGRLDDYLREVAADGKAGVDESDIRQAGLAVTKRAYSIFRERGYEAVLLVAALRGTHHMEGLTGAELVMSIATPYQALLLAPGVPRQPGGIEEPVAPEVIRRLETIPDFVKAYEPEGMKPGRFLSFGLTQRTLSQFIEAGWLPLQNLK